jgi:polar amino acid transport system substrate-binding protein
MKKTILLAVCACVIGFAGISQAGEQVTIAADSWPPFSDEPGAKPGSMVEIAKAVFEDAGYTVTYSLLPWKRVLADVAKGTLDGAVGAAAEDGLAVPSEPVVMCSSDFFVLKKSAWRYTGVASLDTVAIAFCEGYTYGEPLDSYIAKHAGTSKVQAAGGDAPLVTNIRKLMAGRVDTVLETPEVFWDTVAQMGLAKTDFVHAGIAIGLTPYYVGFTPNERGKKLAAVYDAKMAELRKSGRLAKILERYGMTDWK